MSKKSEEISQSWYQKIKSFCENIKVKIEDTIWIQEFDTPMQKIGSRDASNLISKFISNGAIYEGKIPIRINYDEKKNKL